MKYYRVKKEAYDHISGYTAIKDELISELERKRMFPNLKNNIFKEVNISKTKDIY